MTYESFLADVGARPSGTSLDRFPNRDGNYEPGNIRWATPVEQGRNRDGIRFSVTQVREVHELRASGLLQREIAERMGTIQPYISKILRGERWALSPVDRYAPMDPTPYFR